MSLLQIPILSSSIVKVDLTFKMPETAKIILDFNSISQVEVPAERTTVTVIALKRKIPLPLSRLLNDLCHFMALSLSEELRCVA